MQQLERRFLPRVNLRVPMRFRPATKAGTEQQCQTINVSMLGAYFSVDVAPEVGELVQVFIRIPEEVSRKPTAQYCFTARVIHVEKGGPARGKIGVGVNFYSYVRMGKAKRRRD